MATFEELKESWKDKEVFKEQLQLNLVELGMSEFHRRLPIRPSLDRDPSLSEQEKQQTVLEYYWDLYPSHWRDMCTVLNQFRPESIHELGCGVGAASQVIKRHFPSIEYSGSDYSEDAIELAKSQWGTPEKFSVVDIRDMTTDFVQQYDCLLEGAVFDVMPNGDELLEFVLSLKPHNLYVQRMKFTDGPSYYEEYEAYNTIPTCQYYHNIENVIKMGKDAGYRLFPVKMHHTLKHAAKHPTGIYFKGK